MAALGSFSAAARALGISPAMATKHVVAIEDQLGARLFHRTTRRLTLTEAGRVTSTRSNASSPRSTKPRRKPPRNVIEPRGTLRVNAPLAFGFGEVGPGARRFRRPSIRS